MAAPLQRVGSGHIACPVERSLAVTYSWKWVATRDIAGALGVDDEVAEEAVRRAADKGWLELADEDASRFRLHGELWQQLGWAGTAD
jgi:hypothetical protein